METETRTDGLGAMVVEKWLRENHNAGHHLERFNADTLHNLMLSRIRKLSGQIASGDIDPMPIHGDSLDEMFNSLLKSGLLKAENPKVAGEKEKRATKEAADRAQISADADFMLAIMRYEKAVGQRGVSEWYHTKATKGQKHWFDRLFPSGAVRPECPASQQTRLFIIRTIDNGRVRYVSSDGLSGGAVVLAAGQENAFAFGSTRARHFAELLKNQGHITVDILPVNEPSRSAEISPEYVAGFIRENWEAERR